jgi:hypothetical protein
MIRGVNLEHHLISGSYEAGFSVIGRTIIMTSSNS